jgi:hypothetical protein
VLTQQLLEPITESAQDDDDDDDDNNNNNNNNNNYNNTLFSVLHQQPDDQLQIQHK